MGSPAYSLYPIESPLIDWMNEQLCPIEESSFKQWRKILPLVRICEQTLTGKAAKFAALSAIRQWNEDNSTAYTYEEILGRSLDNYTFADCGDWVAYVSMHDQERIIFGEHDTIETALAYAPPSVSWGVLWLTGQNALLVYRSPETRPKGCLFLDDGVTPLADPEGTLICDGLERGREEAFVLPDHVEASILQERRRWKTRSSM